MGQHNPIGGELRIEPCKIDPLKYVCRIRRLQQHRVGSVRRPSRHIHGAKIGGVDLGARDLGSTVDWRAAVAGVRRHSEPEALACVSKAGDCAPATSGRTTTATPATSEALRRHRRSITLPNAIPMSFARGLKQPSRDPDVIPLDTAGLPVRGEL